MVINMVYSLNPLCPEFNSNKQVFQTSRVRFSLSENIITADGIGDPAHDILVRKGHI